jgi:hypothetical protein
MHVLITEPNLLTTLPPSVNRMSENVGASTSRNPKGLHALCRDDLTFYSKCIVTNSSVFFLCILTCNHILYVYVYSTTNPMAVL